MLLKSSVAYSEGGATVRPPPPDREFLYNFCTIFVSFVSPLNHVPRPVTACVLCLFKTASKCTQTYHFGVCVFLLGGPIPRHHTPPPSTSTAPRRLLTEILNTPLEELYNKNFTPVQLRYDVQAFNV